MLMAMDTIFDAVWRRIEQHQGEPFWTKRGIAFSYAVLPGGLRPSAGAFLIPKEQAEWAYQQFPVRGPSVLKQAQGAAYLWGILSDERICVWDW
jgi:hypothetical protein